MNTYNKISIHPDLENFLKEEILNGLDYSAEELPEGFSNIAEEFSPQLEAALAKRDDLQQSIDTWHKENSLEDFQAYKTFLKDIGYLEDEEEDWEVVDEEDNPIPSPAPPKKPETPKQPEVDTTRLRRTKPNDDLTIRY